MIPLSISLLFLEEVFLFSTSQQYPGFQVGHSDTWSIPPEKKGRTFSTHNFPLLPAHGLLSVNSNSSTVTKHSCLKGHIKAYSQQVRERAPRTRPHVWKVGPMKTQRPPLRKAHLHLKDFLLQRNSQQRKDILWVWGAWTACSVRRVTGLYLAGLELKFKFSENLWKGYNQVRSLLLLNYKLVLNFFFPPIKLRK